MTALYRERIENVWLSWPDLYLALDADVGMRDQLAALARILLRPDNRGSGHPPRGVDTLEGRDVNNETGSLMEADRQGAAIRSPSRADVARSGRAMAERSPAAAGAPPHLLLSDVAA
jgi:hypothetical protein